MPEADVLGHSIKALESSRGLLLEPDPVPVLVQSILDILRKTLNKIQSDLQSIYQAEKMKIEANESWQKLNVGQKESLVQRNGLRIQNDLKVNTEDDIVETVKQASISNRKMLIEALPQRFQNALQEASIILEPKATHVSLVSATIRNEKDLDDWLNQTRQTVKNKLKDGPVII